MSLSLVLTTVLMSENTAGGPEPAQYEGHRDFVSFVEHILLGLSHGLQLMGQKFLAYNETGCSTKLL